MTAKHSLLIHTLLYGMAGGSKQRQQLKANADDAGGGVWQYLFPDERQKMREHIELNPDAPEFVPQTTQAAGILKLVY